MRRLTTLVFLLTVVTTSLSGESAAGMRWTAPAGWKPEAAQPMRAATYTAPPAAGDTARAECGVYFFGAGQGGSVDANIARWKSQFQGAGGTPAVAKVATRAKGALKLTTIDTAGEYSGLGGPMAASRAVPGYRLLGAIIEGAGGNIFIKFVGPTKTITANQAKFEQLLASFQPAK